MDAVDIIDISQKYNAGMARYPSLDPFKHEFLRHYDRGDGMCLSRMTMPAHVGTHIDAPFHYIREGKRIDELELQTFYGRCQVVEIREKVIGENILAASRIRCGRILFKTGNSGLMERNEFDGDYVHIGKSGAEFLARQGLKLVGIDCFSVDAYGNKEKDAHKILLRSGIVLLEGINLSAVDEGEYVISCFPLNIEGSEGAPCRAVLMR